MSAAQALLARIVDYAGLFPPAALTMDAAVRQYQEYLDSEHAWMLGNFVLTAGRLEEFRQSFEKICCREQEAPWTLSVVCGGDLANDVRAIEDFQQGAIFLVSLETRAADAESAEAALAALPRDRVRYVELAPASATEILPVLAAERARGKLRTGGVTPESIPPVASVAQFLIACARQRVAFKATAGLHFPLRAEHRLSGDAASPVATMHGFVNVFLAAALAWFGAGEKSIVRTLDEREASAWQIDDEVIRWHDNALTSDQLEQVRNDFAIGFGSCSFREPVDGLRALGWL